MGRSAKLFLITLLVACCFVVSAQAEDTPLLKIGYYPAELYGAYAEFIPDETAQIELYEMIRGLEVKDMRNNDGSWPDTEVASQELFIETDKYSVYLRGEGWIRIIQKEGLGLWIAQDSSVMDYVLSLLKDENGYELFAIEKLHGIVRAELFDGEAYTGTAHEPILITDEEALTHLENLLSNAQPSAASGCPFGYAKLIITTADGYQYTLYPATDSCAMLFIDGSFFDYETNPNDENHDTNQELFDLFEIVPSDYYHKPE